MMSFNKSGTSRELIRIGVVALAASGLVAASALDKPTPVPTDSPHRNDQVVDPGDEIILPSESNLSPPLPLLPPDGKPEAPRDGEPVGEVI